uniref:Uncharacterized protein n=1 Tax=Arundo donax TaxID=35708 RepID=A0A0A9BE96_ARUDO
MASYDRAMIGSISLVELQRGLWVTSCSPISREKFLVSY